jgi:hypothetical protein
VLAVFDGPIRVRHRCSLPGGHLFSPTLPVAALFRERSVFVVRRRSRDTELAAGDYCLPGRVEVGSRSWTMGSSAGRCASSGRPPA